MERLNGLALVTQQRGGGRGGGVGLELLGLSI